MSSAIRLPFLYPTFVRRHIAQQNRKIVKTVQLSFFLHSNQCSAARLSPQTRPCRDLSSFSTCYPVKTGSEFFFLSQQNSLRFLSTTTHPHQADSFNRYGIANENPLAYSSSGSSTTKSQPVSSDNSPAIGKDEAATAGAAAAAAAGLGQHLNRLVEAPRKSTLFDDNLPKSSSSSSSSRSDTVNDQPAIDKSSRGSGILGTMGSEPGLVVLGGGGDDAIPVGGISDLSKTVNFESAQGGTNNLNEEESGLNEHTQHIHYFDSWTAVRELEGGGLGQNQSIAIMKATRSLLSKHLEQAQKQLVSRSQVENDSYLFRAACSEIRTEIQSSRRAEMEHQRTQRAQLQTEVEILSQKLSQELNALREEVKGLFDDRKMTVRMDQRTTDSRIQELGHKITVVLNSEARSQVENVRWVLTRRAATALAVAAIMLLFTLRYYHHMVQIQERERKKMEAQMAAAAAVTELPQRGEDTFGVDGEVYINTKL